MKKFLVLAVAALTVFFASCGNGIDDEREEPHKKSSDGKTYLVVGSASVAARTLSGYEADKKNLTELKLTGKWENGEAETIATASSFDALTKEADGETAKKYEIQAGSWEFTLSAKLNGVIFEATTPATLTDGEETTVSFELESTLAYGGLSITVEFDNDPNLTKVVATLKNPDKSEISGIIPVTIEAAGFTEVKDGDTVTGYSVTYSRSAANEDERLASGSYYLVFDFYADGTEGPINSIPYLVRVADGLTTAYSQAIKLNETYTIKYYLDGSELEAGETRPGKYSRKTDTIKLPQMEKANYVFSGWFTNSEYDGEPITEITKGSSGNITLWAKFDKELGNGSIEVHLDVKEFSDIEVNYTAVEEVSGTTLTLTADAGYSSYAWKVDGEAQDETGNVLTIDASDWATGVYDVSLVTTDSDGEYFSWFGQLIWTKKYTVTFVTNKEGASVEPQYIVENADGDNSRAAEPTEVKPTYGWYTKEDFTEAFDFENPVTQSMTLYGCWDLGGNIYVSENGADGTGRGTVGKPLASIAGAAALMKDSTKDYTILVGGEITGAQTIGSSNGSVVAVNAKSITIEGKNGSDTDILNGGFTADKGTTLTISTSVPVTIKNLKITGGYAENGGGVYVASSSTLIMESGEISGNSAIYEDGGKGGGVYVDYGATFKMGGGVIKGNSALENRTDTLSSDYGGKGGGVYVKGTMFMYGDAVIGDDSQKDTATSSSYSNIANLGGGVYIATSGSEGAKMYMGYSAVNTTETLNGGIFYNYTMYTEHEWTYPSGCGGGVNVEYTSNGSYDNATLAIASGTIAYNASEKNGGGVYLQTNSNTGWAVLSMTGGTISGNKHGSGEGDFGSGVYVASSGVYNAEFFMGGSAVVSSDNDVWFDPENVDIMILSELTGEAPVATITPDEYSQTETVIAVAEGVTSTTLKNEYTKFAVTPSTDPNTSISKNWYVSSDGKLLPSVDVASLVNQIGAMTESGTVTVSGYLSDSSELTKIRDAICLNSSVNITLDLSGVVGLTKIPSFAFCANGTGGCPNLVGITLPEGITEIEELAFRHAGFTTFNISASVTTISARAFLECSSLASVTVATGNTAFKLEEDGALYSHDGKTLVMYGNKTATGTFAVPDAVTEIGDYAFCNCNIESVTFGTESALTSVGSEAFYQCAKLASISLPNTVSSIGQEAFMYCAFTSFVIPDEVEVIENNTFGVCSNLTTITIPASVTEIGSYAFTSCPVLTTVNYKGTEEQKEAMTIDDTTITASTVTWVCNYVGIGNKAAPDAIGDIVFNDGTAIAYSENLALTDEQKAAAVAVIFYVGTGEATVGTNENILGKKTLGVGVHNTGDEGSQWLVWAPEDTPGYKNNFSKIWLISYGTPPTESTLYYQFEDHYMTGDFDGSDNWTEVCAQDATAADTAAENYPAFNWVNNYASNYSLKGVWKTGWNLPTGVELHVLYNSLSIVNAALEATGGTEIGTYYWSSSQDGANSGHNNFYVFYIYFVTGTLFNGSEKSTKHGVCCIRAF